MMKKYKLSQLLKIKNGKDHKSLADGKIPVYGSGGLMRYVDEYIYDKPSILLPRKGSLHNIQYTNKPFWTVDTLYYTEINEELVAPYFLYYYLKGLNLENLNTGTGVPSMTFNSYYDLELQLPEIKIQKLISDILEKIDKKISVNNQLNDNLEALAKTIYDYWFVQFDFPDENGKPYKSSEGKMVYNKVLKREIPEGWEVKTIGDYCKSTGGFAFKSSWWTDQGYPVIKIKDIQENYKINLEDLAYVNLTDKRIDDKFKAKPGDILIAMTGATVGKYAMVPFTEMPLYVNQRVGYFNLGAKPEENLPFLINSLNQRYFREAVFMLAKGAAQPNISNEQINNIQLILPKADIIKSYNKIFESYYLKNLLNQQQNQQLTQLRDWLLPMLMNGQVSVK